jgi:hypothetical protein
MMPGKRKFSLESKVHGALGTAFELRIVHAKG